MANGINQEKLIEQTFRASFSCLAFLRGLFPEDYFKDQVVEISNEYSQIDSLSQRSNSNSNIFSASSSGKKLRLKMLSEEKAKASEMYAHWIDTAVEVMKKKYAKRISLFIYDCQKMRENLIETFQFEFHSYSHSIEISLNISALNEHEVKKLISVTVERSQSIEVGLFKVLRRFITAIQKLPPTDECTKRILEMEIGHTNSCPLSFQLEGFDTFHNADKDSQTSSVKKTFKKKIDNRILESSSEYINSNFYENRNKGLQVPAERNSTPSTIIRSSPFMEVESTPKSTARHCECNSIAINVKSNMTKQCSKCHRYFHTICYGYHNSSARFIKKDQILCYTCTYRYDKNSMDKVKCIILLRRMVKYATYSKPVVPKLQEYSSGLNIPIEAVDIIYHLLKTLGFFQGSRPQFWRVHYILFVPSIVNLHNYPLDCISDETVDKIKNTGAISS